MAELHKTVEALLALREAHVIDDDEFVRLNIKAIRTNGRDERKVEKQEKKEALPLPIERHRYPKRENWEYNGVRLPSGATTHCLLFLAEHAGTAFGASQVRRGLNLPNDKATRSTIGSSLTVLKQQGLVHHESPSWWISDLGMDVAAAYQREH